MKEDQVMLRRQILKYSNRPPLQLVDLKDINKPARFTNTLPVVEEDVPMTYREAKVRSEIENWKDSMDEKMDFLYMISIWKSINHSKGNKATGSKWIFAKEKKSFRKKSNTKIG